MHPHPLHPSNQPHFRSSPWPVESQSALPPNSGRSAPTGPTPPKARTPWSRAFSIRNGNRRFSPRRRRSPNSPSANSTPRSASTPRPTCKWCMPFYTHVRDGAEGFGDMEIRLKHNLWGNDEGATALALMPFIKTSHRERRPWKRRIRRRIDRSARLRRPRRLVLRGDGRTGCGGGRRRQRLPPRPR